MRGYIEVKEDSYESAIEHIHEIKQLACKLIKKLSEHSDYREEDYEEEPMARKARRGRYGY